MHVTDASNASRTMLFDIHRGEWDDELLALFGVPRSLLPRVVPSSGVCAEMTLDGAQIPIAGIAGDQQAALFGQACLAPGMAKNTYGTGCFMLMNTGRKPVASTHNLLTTVAWQRGDTRDYALEGSVFIAGAVVQWLRDGLKVVRSAAEVEVLAASVPDTGGVYFVPAFAGLGAPHWDPHARGAIVGLTRGTTTAHIARAAIESIAFQSADVLRAMQKDAGITLTQLRVDGGATANNLLMQFQADVLGVPVVRPRVAETTALGAAYLAGLATGYWKDDHEVGANWQVDRRFVPSMPRDRVAELVAGWNEAVGRVRTDRLIGAAPARICAPAKRCICSQLTCICAFCPDATHRPPFRSTCRPRARRAVRRVHLRSPAPRRALADAALRRRDGAVRAADHAVLADPHAGPRRTDAHRRPGVDAAPRPHRDVAQPRAAVRARTGLADHRPRCTHARGRDHAQGRDGFRRCRAPLAPRAGDGGADARARAAGRADRRPRRARGAASRLHDRIDGAAGTRRSRRLSALIP